MTFSTNEWVILALVLILGWLLGLLSRSGSGRWKRAYEEEHAQRLADQVHYEARVKAANERIAELERHAPPVGAGTGGAVAAAARGGRDDLTLIRGINRTTETRLNDFGIHRYRDITGLTTEDEAALEGRMGAEPGYIAREQWREQAELLVAGRQDEHRSRFG